MTRFTELAPAGQVMAAEEMKVGAHPSGAWIVRVEQPLLEEPNSVRLIVNAKIAYPKRIASERRAIGNDGIGKPSGREYAFR